MANRPFTVAPESVVEREQSCADCVACFITVEKHDDPESVAPKIAEEIKSMADNVGRKSAVVFPFAHLSNNLAPSAQGLKTLQLVEECLKKQNFTVIRGHFGSHKELLIDVYGHPGNVRFRDF